MRKLGDLLMLRDPAWQPIGVLIGAIAIIVSVAVAYDIDHRPFQSAELTVREALSFDPFLFFDDAMDERVVLLIDSLPAQSAIINWFIVSNTGQIPIRPEDYTEPISVSARPPWELLVTETTLTQPPELSISWTKTTTNTFEMEPTLLNPGDKFNILLLANDPAGLGNALDLTWSGRIVNLPSINVQANEPENAEPTIFEIGISHYGWGMYALAGAALSLAVVGIWLGVRCGRISRLTLREVLLLAGIMALSFSSADILVDFLEKGNKLLAIERVLLSLHVLLLLYLLWPDVRKRLILYVLADQRTADTPEN